MQTILFLWVISGAGATQSVQQSQTTFFDMEACRAALRLHTNTINTITRNGDSLRSIGYCASRGTGPNQR